MKKKISLFIGLGILAAVIVAALIVYNLLIKKYEPQLPAAPESTPSGEVGSSEAPSGEQSDETEKLADFTVTDADGNEVTLYDSLDMPVVLNFWATWCGYCKQEMPDFDAAYEEYGEHIRFMMVNVTDGGRETIEKAKKFIEEQGYKFPIYFDETLEVSDMFAATQGIPKSFFIGRDGALVTYANGMLSKDNLQKGIDLLLEHEKTIKVITGPGPVVQGEPDESGFTTNPSWCSMKPEYVKLTSEESIRMIGELDGSYTSTILDTRPKEDFDKGHIDGAINLAADKVSSDAPTVLPKDSCGVVFVYGATDEESEAAARALVELEYNHVYDIGDYGIYLEQKEAAN